MSCCRHPFRMLRATKNKTAVLVIAAVAIGTATYLLAVVNRLLRHPQTRYP